MQEKTPQSFGEIIAELQKQASNAKVVLTTYKFFIDEKEVQKVDWLRMEKILQSSNTIPTQPYTIAKEKVIVNDKMILFNYKITTNGR